MIKPPGYKDMCETCKGTGKTDFVFGIVKVECMACDGVGFHKAPPPAPPPRQPMNEITVNIKSDKKEVESVDNYLRKGDKVRYIGDYQDFKGSVGEIEIIGNESVSVKTETGNQIWKLEHTVKLADFQIGDLVFRKNVTIEPNPHQELYKVEFVFPYTLQCVKVSDEQKNPIYLPKSECLVVARIKGELDSPTKPSHYGKLDVFNYAKEHFTVEEVNAYHQITAIKYITRAGKKDGNPYEQDIKKAIVHLEECLKGEEG